jgi:hypothetical protein
VAVAAVGPRVAPVVAAAALRAADRSARPAVPDQPDRDQRVWILAAVAAQDQQAAVAVARLPAAPVPAAA